MEEQRRREEERLRAETKAAVEKLAADMEATNKIIAMSLRLIRVKG